MGCLGVKFLVHLLCGIFEFGVGGRGFLERGGVGGFTDCAGFEVG